MMYLFGASGHGKVIVDILLSSNSDVQNIFFIDENPSVDKIFDIPIMNANKVKLSNVDKAVICIGNNKIRAEISQKYRLNYLTLIHKDAVVSKFSKIGKGTVVMANTTINPDAIIGQHCIINTASVIEHDCKIEDFVHISPNASLAGSVTVGEGTHIGIGASVIQGVKIGKWTTVGAGAVVLKDVPDYAVVVGNPAKIIKCNDSI